MMANKIPGRYAHCKPASFFSSSTTFVLTSLAAALMATGCATEKGMIPAPLYEKPEPKADSMGKGQDKRSDASLVVGVNPQPPAPARLSTVKPSQPSQPGAVKEEEASISLMFDQIPLPSFIQVSFGTILKKNFSVDPQVSARTDLVTLRTGSPQTPTQTLETVKLLLKSYGIAVTELGGFYRIAPDNNLSAYAPEIRRGRAQPEVPLPLRPVFNLVELTALKVPDVAGILRTMFGQKITVQEDQTRNALLLSGQSVDITAALEAIQVLDQPLIRGRGSRSLAPKSLSADELARKLVEVLTAEGYAASTSLSTGAPILFVPIPASNSLLAFAGDKAILDHIVAWARKLDIPDASGKRSGGYFSYPVKYADAQDLAKTMQELLSASTSGSTASATPAVAGAPVAPAARAPSKIVVNSATNTLIFLSTQDEYTQLLGILKELDQPAKSALIEVTVAEVDVSDANSLGIQWNLDPSARGGGTVVRNGLVGSLVDAASATGLANGLSLGISNPGSLVMRARINALANANKATILSTPRIMARNGETATIQVGIDVPIVTSTLTNANTVVPATGTGTGTTGLTQGQQQTIQYRTTGTILKVKPVIHSGNRIELDVSQEVSTVGNTGAGGSPNIGNKKVETKLSIRDGATVVLGGLISTNNTKDDVGVPYLKDVPVLGALFGYNARTNNKTELIILITPYIIDDDLVAEQVTQAFRDQVGVWAQPAPSGAAPRPKVVVPNTASPAVPQPDQPQVAMPVPEQPASNTVPDDPAPLNEPVPVPAGAAPPATPSPESAVSPIPSGQPGPSKGAQVMDPALLEELRKAGTRPPVPAKTGPK